MQNRSWAVKTSLSNTTSQGFHINPVNVMIFKHRMLKLAHLDIQLITNSFYNGKMFLPPIVIGIV